MARNKYAGFCYCCKKFVPIGHGHFEKIRNGPGWRIKCVKCASGRTVTDDDPCVKKARSKHANKQKNVSVGRDVQ